MQNERVEKAINELHAALSEAYGLDFSYEIRANGEVINDTIAFGLTDTQHIAAWRAARKSLAMMKHVTAYEADDATEHRAVSADARRGMVILFDRLQNQDCRAPDDLYPAPDGTLMAEWYVGRSEAMVANVRGEEQVETIHRQGLGSNRKPYICTMDELIAFTKRK